MWAAVSHADVIKSVLADALGTHLDLFQRLHVDPASLSVIRYTATRPYVVTTNSTNADLAKLLTPPPKKAAGADTEHDQGADDAAVGGGLGAGGHATDPA